MGPPSYMQSVVNRNVVMRRIIVSVYFVKFCSASVWTDIVFSASYFTNKPILVSTIRDTPSLFRKLR